MGDLTADQIDRMQTVLAITGKDSLPIMLEIINKSVNYALDNAHAYLGSMPGSALAAKAQELLALLDEDDVNELPDFMVGAICGVRLAMNEMEDIKDTEYSLEDRDWKAYAGEMIEIVKTLGSTVQ